MSQELDPEFAAVLREVMSKVSARDVGEFSANQPLSDLGLDSVSLAEVVVMLEDHWNLSLDPREIESLNDFGQLQEVVRRARTQK